MILPDYSFRYSDITGVGRTRTFDTTDVEHRAMEYFWRYGYRSTSVDDLVGALGISRSSLYSVWNGKEALYRRAFQLYLRTIAMEALKPIQEMPDPREAIEAVFAIVARQISGDPFHRGCMMVNTITELSAVEPNLAQVAHDARRELHEMFRSALNGRVAGGESTPEEVDGDAEYLVTLFLGLRVLAQSGPDRAKAEAIVKRGLEAVFGRDR